MPSGEARGKADESRTKLVISNPKCDGQLDDVARRVSWFSCSLLRRAGRIFHVFIIVVLPQIFTMTRPNILLITSDQQHFNMLGAVNPKLKTPALDRLCNEGTRFNRAYCPNPTCTPTRASIITGMYPHQHGAWTLGTKLDEAIPTRWR